MRTTRAALALVALLVSACAPAGLAETMAERSPTPTATASRPIPTPPMTPVPTAAPTSTVSTSGLPAGLATVAVDRLRVRTNPGLDSSQVSFPYADNGVGFEVQLELYEGIPVWLLDEAPVVRDGLEWRKIAVNNTMYNDGSLRVGWVAQTGFDGSPWLAPFSHDCPVIVDGTVDQPELDRLRWMSLLGPACFGGRSITFAAYWPELPPGTGPGEMCPEAEPQWLLCNPAYGAHVNVTGDSSQAFAVHAPDVYARLGERGSWLQLTGHFDDPAAQECVAAAGPDQDTAELEMFCRTRFVLERAGPIPPP